MIDNAIQCMVTNKAMYCFSLTYFEFRRLVRYLTFLETLVPVEGCLAMLGHYICTDQCLCFGCLDDLAAKLSSSFSRFAS